MDTTYGFPGTAPSTKKRTPFDLSALPPEMQQQLVNGQSVSLDDGSVLYPDGTMDSGVLTGGYDMGPGGWNKPPELGGVGSFPGTADTTPGDPLAGPLFRRYRQTVAAGMPGQAPADTGLAQPALDVLPPPFGQQPPPSVNLTVESPRVGDFGAGTQQRRPQYGGRIGRRLSATNLRRRR